MAMLIGMSIIPALVCFVLDVLQKKTSFGMLSNRKQQIIIGILFGGLAILFTEYGIDIGNAIVNIRDSAPLCAGLLFGGPAGIIAAIIGGTYRWFCVYWGVGTFTRLACSIATLVAGALAAASRKYVFEEKRPGFGFASGIAIGTEVLHMMLILMTNIDNMSQAFDFVDTCAYTMILCNAIAVALATIVVERKIIKIEKPAPILQMFTVGLLLCFLALLGISFITTYTVNIKISDSETEELLRLNLDDVIDTIEDRGITKNISTWRVGKSGGIIVCDESNTILSAGKNGQILDLKTINIESKEELKPDTFYSIKLNGDQVYCEYRVTGEYIVYAYMMAEEADLSSYITFYMMLFAEILIYLTVFFLVFQIVKKTMTDKLNEVNVGLNAIAEGDLNTAVNVRTSKEFNQLSDDINQTVDTLKEHIKEAEKRNERELEMAHQIQQSAVPFIFPPFPKRNDIDIYALMNTAKEVGGDFYDFYFTDDNHFAFLIADVSGKGIPAAMFMMASKTLMKGLAERGKTVDLVFQETNEKLCNGNDAGMFLTAWMGVINLENGHLAYANAGHNSPVLYQKNKNYNFLKDKPNFILAGMEGTTYTRHECYMNPGDSIYLYTDGVTEAENQESKQYGEYRLERILMKTKDQSPETVCHMVEDDVKEFVNGAAQSDDITMLSFRLNYLHSSNSIIVYPSLDAINLVTEYVDNRLNTFHISTSVRNKVQISVDEIFSNIVKYGNATRVEIRFGFEEERLVITILDNGAPFDPTKVEMPDTTLSAEDREIGGLGIFLVKKLSSSISYENKNNQNNLDVVFDLKIREEKE